MWGKDTSGGDEREIEKNERYVNDNKICLLVAI